MSDLQYAIVQTIEDGYGSKDLPETADDIIALFRDSLLSDDAVEAGSMRRWKGSLTFLFKNYAYQDLWNDDSRKTITAALDAVTGDKS